MKKGLLKISRRKCNSQQFRLSINPKSNCQFLYRKRRQSLSLDITKKPDFIPVKHYTAEEIRVSRIESFLREIGDNKVASNLQMKMRRLLKKYKERKAYEVERKREWDVVNHEKPNPHVNHADDVQAISEAETTIGDYKLKTSTDFEPSESENTLLKKFEEILSVREKIYLSRKQFNDQVFLLRKRKTQLLGHIIEQQRLLDLVHHELPKTLRKPMPEYRPFDMEEEFPEKNLCPDLDLNFNLKTGSEELQKVLSILDLERDLVSLSQMPQNRDEGKLISVNTKTFFWIFFNLNIFNPGLHLCFIIS